MSDLIELEREGWEALLAGHGGTYYRRKLARRALMVFPFGVLSREEAIEAMEAAPPWQSYEMREPRVLELSRESATVIYRVTAQRPGQQPFSALLSSTFVREDDEWKLAFHQQSP